MKNYWITLYPETFIWKKRQMGFIYNSLEMKGFTFVLTKKIESICEQLILPINLYSTLISSDNVINKEIKEWLYLITKIYKAGYLSSSNEKRRISYKPILKIIEDTDFHKWEKELGFDATIVKNLHELTFYLNNSEYGDDFYYKQIPFPMKNSSQLNMESILDFAKRCHNPYLTTISLVGNIFNYPHYNKFLVKLTKLSRSCVLSMEIQDFIKHSSEIETISTITNLSINILIGRMNKLSLIDCIKQKNLRFSFTVVVTSDEDYRMLSEQIENHPLYDRISYFPIYTNNNIGFFEKNVYLNQNDINEIRLSKREIFINQALNTNYFGKLSILPDGAVYSNVNMLPLGSICDNVFEMLHKEFTNAYAWLHVRNMLPCSDCVYQWLCPSPSNYELAIGKPNLCHVIS